MIASFDLEERRRKKDLFQSILLLVVRPTPTRPFVPMYRVRGGEKTTEIRLASPPPSNADRAQPILGHKSEKKSSLLFLGTGGGGGNNDDWSKVCLVGRTKERERKVVDLLGLFLPLLFFFHSWLLAFLFPSIRSIDLHSTFSFFLSSFDSFSIPLRSRRADAFYNQS